MTEPGWLEAIEVAARSLDASDKKLREAVTAARENGASWTEIGSVLGISRQAAHQRFGE